MESEFLNKATRIVEDNISDERFGVSELAREVQMSRSNLLRRIKKETNLSVSQFIRQIRLRQAMDLLKQSSLTVSEISFKVGFSSPSYFIKCFHDHYGYSPGEAGKGASDPGGKAARTHQLVAIMFTDIQGYTAMMQQDETRAIDFRNRHREVFKKITKKYYGKILQYYGDGTLSTFSSAIDAVRCGIEMQQAFRKDPKIPVRIGIHTGDIIASEEEIIGDGVNVAARIESLAIAGSVYISGKVFDEVKNQAGIQTASIGIHELKNVEKPIEVFVVTNPGLAIPEKIKTSGENKDISANQAGKINNKIWIRWLIILAAVVSGYFVFTSDFLRSRVGSGGEGDQSTAIKSIAVLPFINDSNDSSNVYIINGLMDATLNNLQKIGDLRVISRTSVEKYRNNPKTISEISRELNAKYIVEGSGQKMGDQILLNIQLIDAQNDRHIWSEQYSREAKDIFTLQKEVAQSITDKIEVIFTPEEEERINKIPTENLEAYDEFLKGLDFLRKQGRENWEASIHHFKTAIEYDPEFARAHAAISIAYYYLDEKQADKKYSDQINFYADKALLFDAELPQSLIAKALYYVHSREYKLAETYLEKSLEFSPNYDLAFVFLVQLYVDYLPNTEKYLEYALKGLQIDISAYDSVIQSISFLHMSNAFIQSGFVDAAEYYINKSLEYFPENLFSAYVRAFILHAKNKDLDQTVNLLLEVLSKDTNRIDILQEVGKIYYYLRDYENALKYYQKYLDIKDALNLDVYRTEDIKIGKMFFELGLQEASEKYLSDFLIYAENDPSIYKHLNLAMYHTLQGDFDQALYDLDLFSEQENYHYWTLLFLEIDPLMDGIKEHPEFKELMSKIKTRFWEKHEQIKISLEEKHLLDFGNEE